MKVLLLGLPGAGASTVGALLGERLGRPFLDAESLVERTGSVSGALTLLLAMPGEVVAAVPHAAVDDERERARLAAAHAHVVWLRCSLPILGSRVGTRLGSDPMAALRRLQLARAEHYEALAVQVVDTDANPAGAVANLVIQAMTP